MLKNVPYPKPGPVGGRLIRALVRSAREWERTHAQSLAERQLILAVSGGIDSMALALALIKYGRRVAPLSQMTVLHFDHQWRKAASQADAAFVRRFSERLGVPFVLRTLKPLEAYDPAESKEAQARALRREVYRELGGDALILTAHHADDLFETLLWRLFTGTLTYESDGIRHFEPPELRLCLNVPKSELKAFLEEEGQEYREDLTNDDCTFLRSQMRAELIPSLLRIFPKAGKHLAALAKGIVPQEKLPVQNELKRLGVSLRRTHHEALTKLSLDREITLPGGYTLRRTKPAAKPLKTKDKSRFL